MPIAATRVETEMPVSYEPLSRDVRARIVAVLRGELQPGGLIQVVRGTYVRNWDRDPVGWRRTTYKVCLPQHPTLTDDGHEIALRAASFTTNTTGVGQLWGAGESEGALITSGEDRELRFPATDLHRQLEELILDSGQEIGDPGWALEFSVNGRQDDRIKQALISTS